MTECTDGCYWELHVLPRRSFRCSNCGRILNLLKAEAMLNEHATLKREKERLREFVNNLEEWVREFVKTEDALLADTPEGG